MPFDVEPSLRAAADHLRTTTALAIAAVLFVLRPPTSILPITGILPTSPPSIIRDRPGVVVDIALSAPTQLLALVIALALTLLVAGIVNQLRPSIIEEI